MAKKYWEYEDKTEQEDDEYLYVGKIKIIKELIWDKYKPTIYFKY